MDVQEQVYNWSGVIGCMPCAQSFGAVLSELGRLLICTVIANSASSTRRQGVSSVAHKNVKEYLSRQHQELCIITKYSTISLGEPEMPLL